VPLYRITSPEGQTYEIDGPDGATQEEIVAQIKSQIASAQPKEAIPLARQVADVPLKVGAGVVGGVRMVTDAFGANNPVSQNLKGMEGYISDLFSAQSKKDSAEISRIMKDAEDKGVGDQLKAAVDAFSTAPVDFLSHALGTSAPAIAAGMAGAVLRLGALGVGALQAGTGATMGAGIIKGSIYDAVKEELKKTDMSPEQVEARAQKAQEYGGENLDSILAGAALTGLASTVGIDPIIAKGLSKKIIGEAAGKEAAKQAPKGVARRTAEVAALEAVPEGLQGAQEKLAENVALQREGIETPTMRGVVGSGALEALAGAGTGAAVGALSPQGTAPAETPPPEATPEVAPVEQKMAAEAAPDNYYTGSVEDQGLSLKDIQNRDRSGPASIAQMQEIAAKPDYNQVSVSRTLSSGAPVVITDTPIPENRMGKVSNVSAGDGKEIPIQYAVVEAADLTPSHDASGSPSKDFANKDVQSIRPVVGNGRVAGLQQAYINDTAADYKANLLRDDDHGIDPVAIYTMDRPVLVRVMPKKSLTPDIADVGNKKQALEMSAPEQAKIDMGRFDMQGVDFKSDGTPTRESLNGFIMAMPQTEHGNLIESAGIPSKQAVERLNNAMFAKAYDSDALINMHTETADPEAQQVMRALAIAAPAMAQLDKAGEYDIRPDVIKAAEMVVNAKRSGVSLDEYARQRDIGDSENAGRIVQMFADNIRAPKKMGAALTELANTAAAQTDIKEDMFGEKQAPMPLNQVYDVLHTPKEKLSFSLSNITRAEAESLAVSPIVKVNALYKLKKARKLNEANKINDTQFKDQISDVISLMEQAKERGRYKGKVRGPNWIRAKLRTGVHNETISDEEARFVEWLLDQNPNLANDLAIRITTKEGNGVAGQYNMYGRLMTLFSSNMDEGTAVHEILHHTERMMPEDVQEGIKKEWAGAWAKAYKNATPKVQAALDDMFLAIAGDTKAKERTMQAFQNGTLDKDTHYQLFGPSEYWAVNGTRILADRNKADTWVKKAWQWLKELFQRIKGLLGLRSDAPILKALSAILKSSGDFVSKKSLTQAEVNYSLAEGDSAKSGASWNSPEDSQLDRIIEKLQNKLLPLKRAQESIKKSGAEILDKNNPYQQEELYHNRTSKRVDDFISKELNPLLEEMKRRDVTLDQVEEYLQARHAEEANRVIAERNPDDKALQDGGSGMDTADAKEYLDGLSKPERERLSAVAEKVDAILERTRNIYVSEKLVSKAQMSSWKNMFKHYIPLMREDKDGAMGVGQGYSIRGKEVRHRTGSKSKVIDVIANIAIQREKAIVRSEKNRVGKALVGLVKLNPNPEFWTINKVPTERVLNEKTGLVEERSDPLYYKRDNVITVKIEDSKGEIKEHAVVFNEKNPVAVRLASALKNLDATQLEGAMAVSASVTRYFSAINTQYNPIFGVVNLIRDSQASLINLQSTPLAGHQKEVLSKIVPSLAGIYSAVRNTRKGKETTNSYGKLFDELQLEGGMTGYRDLYKDSSDRSKAIKYALDPHAWQKNKLGKIFTAGGRLKVPLAVAQDKAKVIFDWLSDYNLAMEGAARLAVYKTALDNGMSKPQAASLAKNISVNFNRKGLAGQQAGALFAFFNASMQGTARIGETLFTMNNGNIKTLRLNGLGKKIVGGGILLGSMQAIALSLAGFDDDEPPEFIRERNFILPIGGKKYLTLPMPLGFHAIPNIGRITTEFALGGFKKPGDHVLKLLGVFADAFNPIGNSGLSVQTIAPTPIDPLVALGENRDWTGQPISREDYNKLSPTPGFTRSKDVSSDTSRLLAEAINYLSGGTKYTPGKLSPTADQIDYLAGQVTGGVGREAAKISQTAKAVSTGEELPPHKIPLVGRFYGDTDTQSSQGAKFYANLKKLNEVEAELKGRIKDRIPAAEYRAAHPELRLVPLANRVESNVSELRTLKRKLVEKSAPKESIKNIETRITVLMKRLNDRVKEHESREK
jgi:hypothetical protein